MEQSAMVIRILLLLTFCISCGQEVTIPNKLKNASALNSTDYKTGYAIKNGKDYAITPGGPVLSDSSKSALRFFESIPNNTQIKVLYHANTKDGGLQVSEIKKAP